MANYREKMREYLKEPNEYSSQYGKWGALNSEQRQLINRLLNEMDSADVVIKKQYEEKQKLIKFLEDKIKNVQFDNLFSKEIIELREIKREAFQEVLDFVNKGDENE